MYQVILGIHVLLGLSVIGLVLIQHGKGADAGAAFGSASSGSVFGAQGASSFLSRTTAILAALFFATSLGLAVLSGNQGSGSEIDMMDVIDVEDGLSDVPVVDGAVNTPKEALPVINEDVPTVVDTAPASDAVEEKVNTTITDVEKAVKNESEKILDKVDETLDKK